MSGKFENKKKKNTAGQSGKRGSSRKKARASSTRQMLIWGICITLIALLSVLVVLMVLNGRSGSDGWDTTPGTAPTSQMASSEGTQDASTETTGPVTSDETESTAAETEDGLFNLGSGIRITKLLPYTGAFMEDRTDEVVSDVLAIQVTNTGDKYIQTMDITLTAGDTVAVFSLSTLMPGDTMIVLEKNRMAYSTAPEFTEASTSTVAMFSEPPTYCEDKVKIQCLDGVINVTNISGADITGDIFIYYKNNIGGVYYGGITYRLRIEGGLKAGEIRQGSAAHFNASNSTVVFVTCG